MSKKSKVIIVILTSIFILASIVLSVYFSCKSSGQNTNLFTIISGWISGIATLIIGLLTLWLTYKIDKVSKKSEELRDKEQKEQYINQLKLTASPIIYFEAIELLNFSENGIIISNNEHVNRLLDEEVSREVIVADKQFSCEFVFKTPKAENTENIYIKSVDFYIKKLDGFSDEYYHRFVNYSLNKSANLKYKDNGSLVCHTDLLYLDDKDDDILEKLNSVVGKNNIVTFLVDLIASNSLGLSKSYRCGFYFNIVDKEDCEDRKSVV